MHFLFKFCQKMVLSGVKQQICQKIVPRQHRKLVWSKTLWFLFHWLCSRRMRQDIRPLFLVFWHIFCQKTFYELFLNPRAILLNKIMLLYSKGQIISKRFCSGRGFSQKTNENMSHTSKNEFIRSFFGRILGLAICFQN